MERAIAVLYASDISVLGIAKPSEITVCLLLCCYAGGQTILGLDIICEY